MEENKIVIKQPEQKKQVDKKNKVIKEIISYALIILVVVVIRIFIFEPVRVDGPSMDTTLADGQVLILNKLRYRMTDIRRYDIVVVDVDGTRIIKRVIGLPNEVIEIKDNKVYADGKELDNSFASTVSADFKMSDIGLVKVPGDSYIVMGDNRAISLDSRTPKEGDSGIGPVKKDQIIGRVTFRIWPLNKIGVVD
ncbi:MAG: signal peptidase I [Bacilli bacterium]|nr:signal peptidase I [Bacilli bacterium]